MKPVGHETPDIVKKTYSMPDRKLQLAFEEWLEGDYLFYNHAMTAVESLDVSIEETHGLLIQYQDHPRVRYAGLFLSAVYNHHPDEHIIYDIETTPLDLIGYKLAKHKTLTLNTPSGNDTGRLSSGIVITNAPNGHDTGYHSSGIIITNAPSGDYTGWVSSGIIITNAPSGNRTGDSSSGIIITNAPSKHGTGHFSSGILLAKTKPKYIEENNARVLLPEEIQANEQLDKYVEQLCKTTKMLRTIDDITAFKEQYGPNPQKRIEEDIKRLLGPQ